MTRHLYFTPTETPCVGMCSTIYGDSICRGCFRHYQEIIDWNTYAEEGKREVLERLNQQIVAVLQDKIIITDVPLLKKKCAHCQIKIRPDWHPLTWAYALLREGRGHIRNPSKYGLTLKPDYATLRLAELVERIDEEIHNTAQDLSSTMSVFVIPELIGYPENR